MSNRNPTLKKSQNSHPLPLTWKKNTKTIVCEDNEKTCDLLLLYSHNTSAPNGHPEVAWRFLTVFILREVETLVFAVYLELFYDSKGA